MVTSGTGHDRCPSLCPGPLGRPDATVGGDKKISKVAFGFKRGQKIFWRLTEGPTRPWLGASLIKY
jgi:hypothetical protein